MTSRRLRSPTATAHLAALAGGLALAAACSPSAAVVPAAVGAPELRPASGAKDDCDALRGEPLGCQSLPPRAGDCDRRTDTEAACTRLRGALVPRVAEAAMRCVYNKAIDPCDVYEPDAMGDCFLASLSRACPDGTELAPCRKILAGCKDRWGAEITEDTCRHALAAVQAPLRPDVERCMESTCNVDCFDALVPRSPAGPPVPSDRSRYKPDTSATWLDHTAPMPTAWTACRLDTDCTVVVGPCCREWAMSRMHTSAAYLTLDRAKDDACSGVCEYHKSAKCEQGACALAGPAVPDTASPFPTP